MTDSHVKFKVRKAAIGEFPQIGAFQHAIMKDDPLFQSKSSDVSFEDWLRYKWLGKRKDAVVKSEAAIFIAESEDDGQIIGVIGYLKVKRDKVVFLDDQTIPGSKNLRKILDSKEAYADEWHKQVTDTHGDFLLIQPLAVSEQFQRCGIGSALVQHIIRLGDEMGFKVAVSALAEVVGFYQKLGFHQIGSPLISPDGVMQSGTPMLK